MDGWGLCEKIKSHKKTENIPIIFVTVKTDLISKTIGGMASVDYITKPFNREDLINRIKKVLN